MFYTKHRVLTGCRLYQKSEVSSAHDTYDIIAYIFAARESQNKNTL